MKKDLRPYQADALNSLKKRLKEVSHPLLINASVGAGKSLIIAELLMSMQRANYRALCLTMNSTLIKQNHQSYLDQGGDAGIYCSSLKQRKLDKNIIFASPASILNAIKGKIEIDPFNLLVVDEAHNINPSQNETMYMRILNHFGFLAQQERKPYRIIGLTGTPYRDKNTSIIGEHQLFKEEVSSIPMHWLVDNGYLTPPIWGHHEIESIDFRDVRVNSLGKFNAQDLNDALQKSNRITSKIMAEVVTIMENTGRKGVFIFAATKQHCYECALSLPTGQWAIITGETSHVERERILTEAKQGIIKYLINVNCLTTGIDLPLYDTCVWCRPTESLILYIQGIGRVLRLYEGKTNALILDYAGNIQRHGDIDDPTINKAIQPTEETEKDYCIPCYTCNTLNTIHARRCIGLVGDKRCDHFFAFKECPSCFIQNDSTARHCRGCKIELIDPNAKLSLRQDVRVFKVTKSAYFFKVDTSGMPFFYASYNTEEHETVVESYKLYTEKINNIFYAKFISKHVTKPYKYFHKFRGHTYPSPETIKFMISEIENNPKFIHCRQDKYNRYKIIRKDF